MWLDLGAMLLITTSFLSPQIWDCFVFWVTIIVVNNTTTTTKSQLQTSWRLAIWTLCHHSTNDYMLTHYQHIMNEDLTFFSFPNIKDLRKLSFFSDTKISRKRFPHSSITSSTCTLRKFCLLSLPTATWLYKGLCPKRSFRSPPSY